MEQNKFKIVVIDKEENFCISLKESLANLSTIEHSVSFFSALVVNQIKGANCVIIDARLVKDPKNIIEVLHALSVKKIVLTTDAINHPYTSTTIMMGATVFYRHSPFTTLFSKIIDSFSPDKLSAPLENKSNLNNTNISDVNISQKSKERSSKFTLFHSAKGGTGNTSILLNCAINLGSKGLKVLVLDFSLYQTTRAKLSLKQSNLNLKNAILNSKKPMNHDDFSNLVQNSIYTYSYNNGSIDILNVDTPLNLTNIKIEYVEYLHNVIYHLDYDCILIDSSSNLSPLNLALYQLSNEIFLVSSADITSTWALIQHSEIMYNLGCFNKCKLILNMLDKSYPNISEEIENNLSYPLIQAFPKNHNIPSLENSASLIALNQTDPFNTYYKQLAHNIIPAFSAEDMSFSGKNPLFEFLKGLTKKS